MYLFLSRDHRLL